MSEAQTQTGDAFGFKWHQRDTFESDIVLERQRAWNAERFGDVENAAWWTEYGDAPIMLDAGCGAAVSVLLLFGSRLRSVRFIGVDISDAVSVAADRCAERGVHGAFLQDDLRALPLPDKSVDVIYSDGVLHHTDSTRDSLLSLARHLRPGGRFLFYVYNRKSPVREFTDDHIRAQLQAMAPEQAWRAVEPLTRLGIALGELGATVEIPEDIDLLGIPAGTHDVQRLFYWHVAKAYYAPELSFDELNHINYDWYAPANAHRQTPADVRAWCKDAGLTVERERIDPAGITVIARRL
jgi:SAM-dependent methyltransferase